MTSLSLDPKIINLIKNGFFPSTHDIAMLMQYYANNGVDVVNILPSVYTLHPLLEYFLNLSVNWTESQLFGGNLKSTNIENNARTLYETIENAMNEYIGEYRANNWIMFSMKGDKIDSIGPTDGSAGPLFKTRSDNSLKIRIPLKQENRTREVYETIFTHLGIFCNVFPEVEIYGKTWISSNYPQCGKIFDIYISSGDLLPIFFMITIKDIIYATRDYKIGDNCLMNYIDNTILFDTNPESLKNLPTYNENYLDNFERNYREKKYEYRIVELDGIQISGRVDDIDSMRAYYGMWNKPVDFFSLNPNKSDMQNLLNTLFKIKTDLDNMVIPEDIKFTHTIMSKNYEVILKLISFFPNNEYTLFSSASNGITTEKITTTSHVLGSGLVQRKPKLIIPSIDEVLNIKQRLIYIK